MSQFQKPEISLEALLEDLDGDRDLLETILEDFFREYGTLRSILREALADRDRTLASRTAHSMKSGLGMMGWHEGVPLADSIHRLCDAEDLDAARDVWERFDPLLGEMLSQVESAVHDLQSFSGGVS